MRQFIPFEDDWDALERLSLEALIPFRVGMLGKSDAMAQATVPAASSVFGAEPLRVPMSRAVPAESAGA
ncbi:MAG: hypothetical protein KGJ97_07470 [Xanthomonadaceae bacterium]|jgi:hypothetical protein|nr:hypothetical protein [Xanthomonadaceae bacterium]MDE3071481.1 hypothetical protein [Pseudomonadota bacterium]